MNAPLAHVEGIPVDLKLPKGRRQLYRITFDASRTTEEVEADVRARGGTVDAAIDLFGIMLVFFTDIDRLRGMPGLTSLKFHPERDYW